MEPPQAGYEECCYYYDVAAKDGQAAVGAYSPSIDKGVVIAYNRLELPRFVEWKMMGKTDYVLGLEPATAPPTGGMCCAARARCPSWRQGNPPPPASPSALYTEKPHLKERSEC